MSRQTRRRHFKKSKNDFFIGVMSLNSSAAALRAAPTPMTP
ncbi:MAG TPA: hypothetical protein VGZ26_05305 [Pirellulales bacterium]|jgi:hypothetical protein|nr:hypothetical protein [Pirellulales bacterium]